MTEQKYWIWYAELFSFQDLTARKAIELFRSPETLYHLRDDELMQFPQDFRNKLHNKDLSYAERIIENCNNRHIHILACEDECFPKRLLQIADYPYVIYALGRLYDIDHLPAIAVVGTRKCTPYGESVAEGFSKELAKSGFVIVSGLALGVDSCAHMGALKANGNTIAVLGCGIDVVYPKANRDIFELIYAHGMVISEYPPGEQVKNYYFPARNRLISALSLGVLVVEAGKNSGSLITANCALEQGKDVFAVPDSVLAKQSEGSLSLIQQGAKCVFRVEDILEEYEGQYEFVKPSAEEQADATDELKRMEFIASFPDLDETQQKIMQILTSEPIHADEIVNRSALTVAQVISCLTFLEIKGAVKAHAGRRYCLNIKE